MQSSISSYRISSYHLAGLEEDPSSNVLDISRDPEAVVRGHAGEITSILVSAQDCPTAPVIWSGYGGRGTEDDAEGRGVDSIVLRCSRIGSKGRPTVAYTAAELKAVVSLSSMVSCCATDNSMTLW